MPDEPTSMHPIQMSVPTPDPTLLTTENLRREISGLRELLEGRIDGRAHTVNTRLDAMDKALALFQTIADRLPQQMDTRVEHLDAVMGGRFTTVNERFHGIDTQFQERDVRVRDAALSQTTAVNAALQAQKEAAGEQVKSFEKSIDKSEAGTTKQIDALGESLKTSTLSLNDKIDIATKSTDSKISDLKDRLTTIEGLGIGRSSGLTDQRSSASDVRQYILLGFVVLGGILGLLTFVLAR